MTSANFLTALGGNSAQAAVLVLVIGLVRRLWRARLTPASRCGLWLLVAARLVLPVSIPSAVSLFNCIPLGKNISIPHGESEVPGTKEGKSGAQALPGRTEILPSEGKPQQEPAPSRSFPWGTGMRSRAGAIEPWVLLFWVWLVGTWLLAGAVLRSSWTFRRRVQGLEPLKDSRVLRLWEDSCRQLRVRRAPPVYELAGMGCPALYGCLRSRLLLPAGFAGRFSQEDLRYILLHEAAHLKRWDLLWNWLASGLLILHWFNPILWLGFARWRADRELACDALAMEAAGDGSQHGYGETFLRLLESFVPGPSGPAFLGILDDKSQLQRRLEMIGAFRPGRRSGGLVVVSMMLLAAAGLTDAQKENPPPVREATSVAGLVLDEQGKPIPAAVVREAWMEGATRHTSTLTTGPDGRFTASHGAAGRWYYTASAEGYASALAIVDGKAGTSEVRLVLPREQPLSIWVTDGGGSPVPGARVRASAPANDAWALEWSAVTDDRGLAEWKQRPLVPLIVAAQKTVCARVEVGPNESEKRVMLFPMLDENPLRRRMDRFTEPVLTPFAPMPSPKAKDVLKKDSQK